MTALLPDSDTSRKWLLVGGTGTSFYSHRHLFSGREVVEIHPHGLGSFLKKASGVWEGIFCFAHGNETCLDFPRPITRADVMQVPEDAWPKAGQLVMLSCCGVENGIGVKMAEKMGCPVTYSSGIVSADAFSFEEPDGSLSFFRIDALTCSTQDLLRYDPRTETMEPTHSYLDCIRNLKTRAEGHDLEAAKSYGEILIRGPEELRDTATGFAYLQQVLNSETKIARSAGEALALYHFMHGECTSAMRYFQRLPKRYQESCIGIGLEMGIPASKFPSIATPPPTPTSRPCTIS